METQMRKPRSVLHDQENVLVTKGKSNMALPSKIQAPSVRGALGELTGNVQICRDAGGKAAVKLEAEKKGLNRVVKSTYSHVQSKIDTGLAVKTTVQINSRHPLRREESTACHAVRALARTRAALKNGQQRKIVDKENNDQSKRCVQEPKKLTKDNDKDAKKVLKPALKQKSSVKEPIKSLEKLKLAESTKYSEIKTATIEASSSDSSPSLPDDIEDIDAGDTNSPFLLSIYIKDIYRYLTELEKKYNIEPDHLRKQKVVTGKMRATLIDWLVEVQRQFTLTLETFHLAVGIIDRYLQAVPNVQRNNLQLVGVTALYIASKYEEIYAPDVDDFVYVTDNAYKKREVFECERDIFKTLGFCLARPIPLSFLRRFVKAAHGTSKNHHLAKYFVDLSLVEYSMAHYRPSELAAAAICLSLYLLSSRALEVVWTPTLSYYSGYTLKYIKPIMSKIAKIVIDVQNSKHKAVYNKYLDATLAKVSSLPQLKSDRILEFVEMSQTVIND